MWIFNKYKKGSARAQVQIKEIKENIICLPHNHYRMVLETSSINFELKSEAEQDVLLDSFQTFLHSLPTPIQILIRVREVAIDTYLEELAVHKQGERDTVYAQHIDQYISFIKDLVSGSKILSRKFYIVIPYTHTERSHDFSLITQQIYLYRDIVSRGLERLGMKAKTVETQELLDLFYQLYNPQQAKNQKLNGATIDQVLQSLYV